MRLLTYLRCLAAKFFYRSQIDKDMEEELQSHIGHRTDDLERSGLPRAEAERRARIEFGGHGRFKEECYEALGGAFVETLIQDARFSLRLLRKSPGFTVVAVLTLALAICANAVVFGVLNGLILRPLHVPRAESLYAIQHGNETSLTQSYPDYLDLRDRNRSFEGLAAYDIKEAALDTGGNPSRAWTVQASGNYFDVLGIQPYLGRFFHSSDEHGPNSAPYLVLSYDYWHRHFSDDRGVVGRTVRLNKHSFTILGVAPPEFHGTLLFFFPDLWTPIVNQEQISGLQLLNERGTRWIFVTMGHIKSGVTPAQAIADLNSIGSYLKKTYPKVDDERSFTLARPNLYGDYMGRPVRAFLTALMLLAGLILLAACANLGSLFAARAADRGREVALRLALGSSRHRILRGLLTEALLLSLVGGLAGLLGSIWLLRALSVWRPVARFPVYMPVDPDSKVYAIALILALVSGLLFGLVPVRQVLRIDPYGIIKSGGRTTTERRITVRELLLGVQIAICAVLIASSLVAVRGLLRSLNSNFGFEPRNAMIVETDLNMAGYFGNAYPAMQRRVLDAVATVPGVTSVGLVSWPPLISGDDYESSVFSDKTTDLKPANAVAMSFRFSISPRYFRAAGTALLSGRTFTWHDDKNAPRVAIINQEFARKVFGSVASAIGRYYKMPDGATVQVVGVVEDGKYRSLAEDPQPAMFLPILQEPSGTNLVVRSNRDGQQIAAAIRSALRDLDGGLPVYIESWNKRMDLPLFPSRMATLSLGVLGLMGAMLSMIGIFGLAAYSVSRRLKELGIRLALGAQRREVLQAALGRALKLLAFGSTAGLLLGLLASRVLAAIVYQATPRDPLVLTGVVLAMALLGLLATWLPAQRVLSINPATLLREE